MSLIVGLMVLGVALIMIEIFVPGGVVGAMGGVCLIGAVWLSYREGGAEGAIIALAVALVCVSVCLVFEFKVLPKTAVGKRLFLSQRIAGTSHQSPGEASLVGSEGSAATALAPSGYVLVSGRKLEAVSRSGFIEKGDRVRVDAIDSFKVTVSKL